MTAIYLAGAIKKWREDHDSYWGSEELAELKELFAPEEVLFLNPAFRDDDLSDQKAVFGRDMSQVFCSDAVFVDARHRRGLGVGAEMIWAKMNRIPVVTLAPKQSHYRRGATLLLGIHVEKYVHPFVESLSDYLANDLADGVRWLLDRPSNIKVPEFIHETMEYYRSTQFDEDGPMQDLAKANARVKERLHTLVR